MYTDKNFKTKKQLKEAVRSYIAGKRTEGFRVLVRVKGEDEFVGNALMFDTAEQAVSYAQDLCARWTAVEEYKIEPRVITPAAVTYFQPGPFGGQEPQDGTVYFEGPHYPEPHKWYASATVKNGVVIAVK